MTGKILDHKGIMHTVHNVKTWMYVNKHFIFYIPSDQPFKGLPHGVFNDNGKSKMIEVNIGYINRVIVD